MAKPRWYILAITGHNSLVKLTVSINGIASVSTSLLQILSYYCFVACKSQDKYLDSSSKGISLTE